MWPLRWDLESPLRAWIKTARVTCAAPGYQQRSRYVRTVRDRRGSAFTRRCFGADARSLALLAATEKELEKVRARIRSGTV